MTIFAPPWLKTILMDHKIRSTRLILFTLFLLSGFTVSSQIDAWSETSEVCLGEQVTLNSVIELPVEEYNPVYFVHNDTVLKEIFDIGFFVRFFNVNYEKFVIAPNGWISFDTTLAGTFDDWHADTIPSPYAPKNAIMFPWQDWYPYVDDGSYVGWAVLGYAPTRRLIINFFNVKLAGTESSTERGTFQLKIFESPPNINNKIEVHITKKPSSGLYLDNLATIGVNDEQGLRSISPDNRNGTSWTTQNEAWQFVWLNDPLHPYVVVPIDFNPELIGEISQVKWYENTIDPEHYLSTGNTLYDYPTGTTSYIAQILVNETVPYSDTVIVYVNQLPVANAGVDMIIIAGQPATLQGSATGGTPPFKYFWRTADGSSTSTEQNPVVYPVLTTEYILYVVDDKGCVSETNNVIVEVMNSQLFATVSANPTTICKGDEVLLTAKIYGGYPPYQCVWEAMPPVVGWLPDSDPSQTVNPLTSTTFTITVTDDHDSAFVVSVPVMVISVQPDLSGPLEVCENSSGLVFTTPSTGNFFTWDVIGDVPVDQSSENNNEITISLGEGSGRDTIIVVETTNDLYKCQASDSLFLIIHPNPTPVISDEGANPICQYTTGALYSADFIPDNTYQWDMVHNYGTFADGDSSNYQVKIDWHLPGQELLVLTQTSDFGCYKTVTRDITIHPAPAPEIRNEDGISGQEEICENTTRTYTTPGSPDHTYSWNTVPVTLGDEISNPLLNEKTIHWKKEGATSLIVTERNETNCTATSEPFTIIIHPNPVLSLFAESLSVCRGDSALIELNGGDDYDWIEGQDITWITETSSWWLYPGENMHYLIRGTDESTGCSDTLSWDVEIRPNPVVELGDDKYLSPGQTLYLEPGGDFDEYIWFNDDFSEILSYSKILDVTSVGLYHLEVGLKGCTAQDSIWIKMPAGLLPIPNAFTPNSDGENDTFGLVGSLEEITRFNMQIFNRWGALLYETNDPSQPWDGTFNGILCDTGTYVWIISLEEKSSGQNTTNRGFVALLR